MTKTVAIITESSANLPADLIEQYQITVLPLKLNWRGESLSDGIDISAEEVYRRQLEEDYFPSTNTFTPGELKQAVENLGEQVNDALAILLSAKLTSSIQVARLVQAMDLPVPLHVFDSKTAAMAQGFIVLEAARAAAEGLSIDRVLSRASQVAEKVRFVAAIETLKYLARMGRVSRSLGLLGSTLKITPIVALEPGVGEVVSIARPRTWKKASTQLLDLVLQDVGDAPVHMAISHAHHPDDALELSEKLKARLNIQELYINHLTPIMGAAAGPILGVAYYKEDRA